MLWLEGKKHSSKNVKFDATYPVIQLILTYLTSTIETVAKGVKYVKKRDSNMTLFWCFYC